MKRNHTLLLVPATIVLALLAGCNSGGGGGGGDNARGNFDSFLSEVNSIIENTSETEEPRDIGSIELTTPENTEPASIS